MLDIPDVRQQEEYGCGAACLDAVFQFFGVRSTAPKRLSNAVQGMAPDTIEAVLRSGRLDVLSGTMSVTDLQHLTRTGRPVLCCISQAGGHWVVVRGVNRGKVYYQCPTYGPSVIPVLSWLAGWSDETVRGHVYRQWGICPSREQ